MKNTYNKLTCLFGYHDYSRRLSKDKGGRSTHLCKICRKSGYREWDNGRRTWRDYDKEGNCIHVKWNDGQEIWYDYNEYGNCIYAKTMVGSEYWYDDEGNITRLKYPDGRCITR